MDNVFNKLKKYKSNNFYKEKLFKYDDILSLKFNLSKKLNINCFKNDDFDIIKFDKNNLYFEKNIILNNIKKCEILPIYILDNYNNHLVSVIIDNKLKTISLFTNTKNTKLKLFYKKIIEILNLDYNIIIDYDTITCISELCVPLSLLMIYCYFNNVNMKNYINYINNKISIQSSYDLIDYFLNYLEN